MNMSEEDKTDSGKNVPLDLASKISTVKTVETKAPVIAGQQIRNMRLVAQSTGGQTVATPAMITTNISQIIKQAGQPQSVSGTITVQRPAQITLSNLPVIAQSVGTTYHVPRGPAVVANIAAPRSNVAAARGPLVVTQTTQNFVRPPRTPSPATGANWHSANTANGSQIKSTATVLSSPIKTANVNKPQIITRPQNTPTTTALRQTSTILQTAITVGQGGQSHTFNKTGQSVSLQSTGNTVTIAQVLPSRTQTVYSTVSTPHFASSPRVAITSTLQGQRQITTPRPGSQTLATRLPVPQGGTTRVAVTPQILSTGARITGVTSQQTIIGAQKTVATTQAIATIPRNQTQAAAPGSILTSNRISTVSLQPLVVPSTTRGGSLPQAAAKVITQQTAQGPSIHLAQIPSGIKPGQNVMPTTRTINVQPATLLTQRQVVPQQTIPIAKVFPQQGDGQNVTPANVFIHTPMTSIPRRTSPGPVSTTHTIASIPTTTVAAYFYESYSRPYNQQSSFAAITPVTSPQRPANLGIVTNSRYNQIMVLGGQFSQESSGNDSGQRQQQPHVNSQPSTKLSSSPRPSILRKRDHDGSPLKSAKNLQTALSAAQFQTTQQQQQQQLPPISPPSRPDSAGNGNSSAGSTTISATSSPGPGEANEDSLPPIPMNIKEEEENRPPLEMSPRKKPRKQQLTGNDIINENIDEMQFITESNIKKEDESDGNRSDGQREDTPEKTNSSSVRKSTLLNSYRHTWKTTQNHFLRYSDVRPKDERKPTIMDLANQCRILEKINGWKVHHLTTQMIDMAEQGDCVYRQLEELLKSTETKEEDFDSDVNRINELIKGNLQRIKVINDGMVEAKASLMKVFDHKVHVTDIINRCASKRNFKKRDKS